MNHDRPVYQMQTLSNDKPVIYFWDERDGADSKGWWIGLGVGGVKVLTRDRNESK